MTRRSWLPLAAVMLVACCATAGWAADEVRDGVKFNHADPGHRIWVRRTVDSTGTTAGKIDSSVIVYPAKVLPLPVTIGGVVRADTSSKALTLTSAGSLINDDASRDRDNWIIYTNAINDTISIGSLNNTRVAAIATNAGFSAESTIVYSCAQYRRFTLMFRVIPAGGDTVTNVRLAVQVRKHIAALADTASTFVWGGWEAARSFAASDSMGQGLVPTISSSPGPVALYPGEHLLVFNPKQRGDRNTDYFFGPPDGVAVDLVDARGQWFWGPYISVRVRVLTAGGTVSLKPRVVMHLAMGS